MADVDDALVLREIILNTQKPLVLRNCKPKWSCFECTLAEWCRKFDKASGEPQSFEEMSRQCGKRPQWERKRRNVKMLASEFLQRQSTDDWMGLNYKRAHEIPEPCRADVNLDCFGFPQASEDCSYWLASEGGNTPCHYDTYGCNIVIQVKSWLLFPPDAQLSRTRIPYEESSVYCLENFYAPAPEDIEELRKLKDYAHMCILEPNDVLIVPRRWWHFVETLETSLSLNYWVPLEKDLDAQLEECIVKYLMESFVKASTDETTTSYILNPNQRQQIADDSELFSVLEYLVDAKQMDENTEELNKVPKISNRAFGYNYLSEQSLKALKDKVPQLCELPMATATDFQTLLTKNCARFNSHKCEANDSSPLNATKEVLINCICSIEAIRAIKAEFLKTYNTKKAISYLT